MDETITAPWWTHLRRPIQNSILGLETIITCGYGIWRIGAGGASAFNAQYADERDNLTEKIV
jgi:hypothetical protein